jgi:hypothetical protein
MRKNVVVDEAEVPIGKIGHVILDDYDSNKHPKDQAWLGRHPRFVFYYTPTPACAGAGSRAPGSTPSRASSPS